ncbi:hypothetical protein [Mesorhizobium sp. 1M-11]|uniref:hypothetical protein n=1 Tax=Mesorhizobium sp. 1M-11 TaxID=1529006 RepID=UPI000AAC891D|nr:hypothetical protein [Mesorhizobium sp. 1M-11]
MITPLILIAGWMAGAVLFARYLMRFAGKPVNSIEVGALCFVSALWPVLWPCIAWMRRI